MFYLDVYLEKREIFVYVQQRKAMSKRQQYANLWILLTNAKMLGEFAVRIC